MILPTIEQYYESMIDLFKARRIHQTHTFSRLVTSLPFEGMKRDDIRTLIHKFRYHLRQLLHLEYF